MDILGLLPNTKSENQHVIVMTDRYTKLNSVKLVTTVTLPKAVTDFVDSGVILYGIQA